MILLKFLYPLNRHDNRTLRFYVPTKALHADNDDYVIEFYYPCNRNCHYSLSIHPFKTMEDINQCLRIVIASSK